LTNNYRPLFPKLPHRTRLLRLLRSHQAWTDAFLAAPSLVGVMDSYAIELIHPTLRIHLEQLPSYAPELNPEGCTVTQIFFHYPAAVAGELEAMAASPKRVQRLTGWSWIRDALAQWLQEFTALS
jgi:hypothetical protein